VKGLANEPVQQGAELATSSCTTRIFAACAASTSWTPGKRIRLKHDVALFARALENLADGYKFHFNVILLRLRRSSSRRSRASFRRPHLRHALPLQRSYREVVPSFALWRLGKIPCSRNFAQASALARPDHLHGRRQFGLPVMMHVQPVRRALRLRSPKPSSLRCAKRTVLSDNAMSVLVASAGKSPALDSARIRRLFAPTASLCSSGTKCAPTADHSGFDRSTVRSGGAATQRSVNSIRRRGAGLAAFSFFHL